MTRKRKTVRVCQDCWQDANPNDYPPESRSVGTCEECGAEALLYTSRLLPVATCPGYGVPFEETPVVTRCLFCGYHDGRHGDDCDSGGETAEERRASWNTWRNANMPGGE